MIDTTEAARLAAEALHSELGHSHYGLDVGVCDCGLDATAAVAAALPALAEQFASLIEARKAGVTDRTESGRDVLRGLSTAARLVREAAEVTG